MRKLQAAVFDFGETLLSEERAWGVWADWIGATRQELFAAIGATVEGRHPHKHALELCKPGKGGDLLTRQHHDSSAVFAARCHARNVEGCTTSVHVHW